MPLNATNLSTISLFSPFVCRQKNRVGLNFADEAEAEFYLEAVKDNLRQKIDRRGNHFATQQGYVKD